MYISSGGISDSEEPDSLEPKLVPGVNGTRSKAGASGGPEEGNLQALLRLERLAQKTTRRDMESLRKQYER